MSGAHVIDQVVLDGGAEERAFVRALSDRVRLHLRGMDVGIRERHVEIAAHDERLAGLLALSGLLLAVPGYVVETVLGMLTGKGFGGMLAAGLVYLGWFWLSSVAALTMLTLLYAILVEGAEV